MGIVDDTERDAVTRALAAGALGEIACHRARGHSALGLQPSAIASLEAATDSDNPSVLRQAAARALGRANATSSVPTLTALRNNSDEDPIVQYVAAQSLSRITGNDWFDSRYRDNLVDRYIDNATHYRVHEVTP